MFKINKIFKETLYTFEIKEHNATVECGHDDLKWVKGSRSLLAYTCPICGKRHTIHRSELGETEMYDGNVNLTDERLPINRKSKVEMEMEVLRKENTVLFKMINELQRSIQNGTKPAATGKELKKKVEKNKLTDPDDRYLIEKIEGYNEAPSISDEETEEI